MANVVLVLPPFDLQRSLGGGRMRRGNLPPLGVGYLAAALKARGHSVSLVDATALRANLDETLGAVLAREPDVVGISCLTPFAESSYALANALKARRGHVRVVLGGAHVRSFWGCILDECPGADVLVPGEGERVFADLVDRLEAGASFHEVPGLLYRGQNGETVATPEAEVPADLDELAHPARDIYQDELYVPLPNQCRRRPATTVITARGCSWGRCTFCYQGGKYAAPYRRRSPENVVDELARLVKERGIREILFWDDNFCVRPSWIETFCDLLDQQRFDLTWAVQARVNTVSREMLKRMAASGCYNISFGFESGNQNLLDLVNKGTTLDQARSAVRWAKQAGMEIRGSFILGLPTETREMTEQTIRFACELNADWIVFYPYHVQAGTALEELALREGALVAYQGQMHCPTYVPKTYSGPEELAATVRRAYRTYYLRPRYIGRALWRARQPVVLKNYLSAFRFWVGLVRG